MEKLKEQSLITQLRNFVFDWHRFAIDYWWREKYKVPFGSRLHREQNFIDMLIEYEESVIIKENTDKYNDVEDEEDENDITTPEKGKVVSMSQSDIDKEYDEIDLTSFNEKK